MADLQETLNNLKKMYLKKLEADLPSMQSFFDMSIDMEKAIEIRNIVHKLSGTGGMYGLKKLSEEACKVELKLNAVRDGEAPLIEDEIKKDFKHIVDTVISTIKEEECQTS